MAMVKVYRVKVYDIITDEYKISQRFATRDGARRMCGVVIEATEIEIDASRLERGEQWTPKGFTP